MNSRKPLALLLSLSLAMASTPSFAWGSPKAKDKVGATAAAAASATSYDDLPAGSYVPGELLVLYRDGSTQGDVMRTQSQTEGVGRVLSVQSVGDEVTGSTLATLSLDEGASMDEAVDALNDDPSVLVAQPNFVYHTASAARTSADFSALVAPALVPQTSNYTDDPYSSDQSYLASIKAPEAWKVVGDLRSSSNRPAVVVIDAGFDSHHPDLTSNLLEAYDITDQDSIVDDTMTTSSSSYGHGTHVAGLISATANNGIGIAGASNGAGLVLVKLWNDHARSGLEMTTDTLVKAYEWVINGKSAQGGTPASDYNVRVINVSLGMEMSESEYNSDDRLVLTRMDDAMRAGIVTVGAAGNKGPSAPAYNYFPGDYRGMVSVMSLNSSDTLLPTSNYNLTDDHRKDVCAPGQALLSTWPTTVVTSKQGYRENTGTSMASPLVAGVFAMMFAAKPSLTASQAVDLLFENTQDLGEAGWDRTFGYGKVNAEAAVRAAAGLKPATPDTPETADTPQSPVTPQSPLSPTTPASPDTPDSPTTPESPQTPDSPVSPSTPTSPASPATPVSPSTPATPDEPVRTNTWITNPDGTRSYLNERGERVRGWHAINGSWYWFDQDTNMVTGWRWISTNWYYFNRDGVMQTGWQWIDDKWFWFDRSGAMAEDWRWIDNAWYHFGASGVAGAMDRGWIFTGGRWYLLRSDGVMLTGWQWDRSWFYLGTDGSMRIGWHWIDGHWYLFNGSGRMQTGWVWDNGWLFLGPDGALRW